VYQPETWTAGSGEKFRQICEVLLHKGVEGEPIEHRYSRSAFAYSGRSKRAMGGLAVTASQEWQTKSRNGDAKTTKV
jgi:hypothetical protein